MDIILIVLFILYSWVWNSLVIRPPAAWVRAHPTHSFAGKLNESDLYKVAEVQPLYHESQCSSKPTLATKTKMTAANIIQDVFCCCSLQGAKQLLWYPSCNSHALSPWVRSLNGHARSWRLLRPQHWNSSWMERIACAFLSWKIPCHCCSRLQERILSGKRYASATVAVIVDMTVCIWLSILNIVFHRQLRRVALSDGGAKSRVATSVSAVIGDMRVTMAGTHVGKGRSNAAVRAHDNLSHERAVNHYSHWITCYRYDYKRNNSRSKDQGYSSSLMAKFISRTHRQAGLPASYQKKHDIEDVSHTKLEGHHSQIVRSFQGNKYWRNTLKKYIEVWM